VHNLTLGLLQTDHLANGEQLNTILAVTETFQEDMFSPQGQPQIKETYRCCRGKSCSPTI